MSMPIMAPRASPRLPRQSFRRRRREITDECPDSTMNKYEASMANQPVDILSANGIANDGAALNWQMYTMSQ